MTTPILLLFGLLAVCSICALLIAIAALSQTRSLWHSLMKHESECRATDAELFETLRKQFASCSKIQADILSGVNRLEGADQVRRDSLAGGRRHV
jgi:hypothetical protein